MFYECSGEIFKEVLKVSEGAWIISYENPSEPRFVEGEALKEMERIEPPGDYKKLVGKKLTEGQKRRLELIEPLLQDDIYIVNQSERRKKADEIADASGSTRKRIQRLFFRHLAGQPLVMERETAPASETDEQKDFAWAISQFYYSAKKMSLRTTYDLMLLARYTDTDGHLMADHPTWHQFRHFFYDKNYHKKAKSGISRNGLSDYQRNSRPLFGSASEWKNRIGAYQMDETQADIYLVSRLDRKIVIGRPNVYLAVDTATQLIAGIHIGLESGEQAVMSCLANAAMDKVEYCKSFGIEITRDEWPSMGLPREIITDKGLEFSGKRISELAVRFGMEYQSLPPFRPDGKGLVEKSFDLIQQKYKPLLRGKGVIEEDAQERWAVDYRSQAVLDLDDFTKIVIHCVLYLNSRRILENSPVNADEAAPVPAQLWKWHESRGESSIIPVNQECLYQMGLPRKKATVARKGINHQGLWYVGKEHKKLLESMPIGNSVQIAYDPDNVSRVYLVEGVDYIPLELVSYQKQYAGAVQEEYRLEKQKIKSRKMELEELETEGRIKVLRNIQGILDSIECQAKGRQCKADIQKNREKEVI